MGKDMCVPCESGIINLRVGAIIMKDDQILMVGNKRSPEYLYSVGGRIQFGETAEEAVRREVREEEIAEYEKYTQTKKYVEEVAKEKLGLVYEGEIIFKDEN